MNSEKPALRAVPEERTLGPSRRSPRAAEPAGAYRPVVTCAIDDEALATLRQLGEERRSCDACGTAIEGEAAGKGLLMWARGDDVRFEEPLLCWGCAAAVGITALHQGETDEEQEG
jgi:hypothetical protein